MAGSGSSPEGQPLQRLEAEMGAAPRPNLETKVVFLPRDPQWAFVHWEISAQDQQNVQAAKAEQLVLRVWDVTGLPVGSVHLHTLQELLVNALAREWFVPVPMSDRDYQVELGYRMAGGGWLSVAVSAPARMQRLDQAGRSPIISFPLCWTRPQAKTLRPCPSRLPRRWRRVCMSVYISRPAVVARY